MRAYLRTAICGFMLALWGSAAEAQVGVARSLEQLQLLVRPGDSVEVIDTTGTEISGRISRLSDASLVVEANGGEREWSAADIRVIRQRRGDPLGNGALIGFGIGAGMGLAVAAAGCATVGGNCVAWGALATGLYGAVGAGVGVGIDALVTRRRIIYSLDGTANLFLSPVFIPTRRGLLVSLTF